MHARKTVLGLYVIAGSIAAALFTPLAEAKKPSSATATPAFTEGPAELPGSQVIGDQRIEEKSGRVVAIYNLAEKVTPAAPEAMAREYLRRNAAVFRMREDLSDLALESISETPGGYHIRFEQRVRDLPVLQSDIVVNLNRAHQVTLVLNGYTPGLSLPSAISAHAVTRSTAAHSARETLRLGHAPLFQRSTHAVEVRDGRAREVIAVDLRSDERGLGDWRILVDATNGAILEAAATSAFHRAGQVEGRASVFNPTPLTHAHRKYGDSGFGDGDDTDSPELTTTLTEATLPITASGNRFSLSTPYAIVVDSESPTEGDFSQNTDDFRMSRAANGFEAVNMIFHIDQSMRYVNETLGFTVHPIQYTGGVRADPHGLGGEDNSHYSPWDGELAFGEGGVDDAEDFHVVLHELGHGIHDWITQGHASQAQGLGEGSGDYWAMSYDRSLGFWKPADAEYQWVFSWDGHNPFWPGRVTNYPNRYPAGLRGQIHTDGQIWASSLMEIYDQIGREATDRNFIEGLAHLGSNSNQQDAAAAFLQADRNLYQGAHAAEIIRVFQTRGYAVQ